MTKFTKPYSDIRNQESFGLRETGITHPDSQSFIRLRDNGDVEISAGPGISIILHPQNKSITFIADSVKFMVKETAGVKVNDLIMNTDATNYAEPAFIPMDPEAIPYIFDDAISYVKEEDSRKVKDAETGHFISWEQYTKKYGKDPVWNGLYYE